MSYRMGNEYFLHKVGEDEFSGNLKKIKTEFKDETLIWSKFITGDNSALSYIYQTYANSLYNYGRQFTDDDTAGDCIQDLFYDLIKSRKKLGSAISIKAYLFSSLRRKIARKVKRNAFEIGENNLDKVAKFKISIASDNSAPVDNSTQNRVELLKNACNSLPARQREAIMLYYFEKLSYKEIARILDMNKVYSARILIYRALGSLKNMLGNVKDELIIVLLACLSLS